MAEKKVSKVITGTVETSTKKKIRNSIIAKDGQTVKEYAIFDVLIPSVKRLFYDFSSKILSMILFGDGGRGSGSASGPFDYSRQYQKVSFGGDSSRGPSSAPTRTNYSGFEYDTFIFETRGDVEKVIDQLSDCIEQYGQVSVSELYDAIGKTAPYTAENYGWISMAGAKAAICSEGFRIILPPVKPLK